MFDWMFDLHGVVLVGFLAWVAVKLSRALRARDVDYSRAMAADMVRREQQAAEGAQRPPSRKPDPFREKRLRLETRRPQRAERKLRAARRG